MNERKKDSWDWARKLGRYFLPRGETIRTKRQAMGVLLEHARRQSEENERIDKVSDGYGLLERLIFTDVDGDLKRIALTTRVKAFIAADRINDL